MTVTPSQRTRCGGSSQPEDFTLRALHSAARTPSSFLAAAEPRRTRRPHSTREHGRGPRTTPCRTSGCTASRRDAQMRRGTRCSRRRRAAPGSRPHAPRRGRPARRRAARPPPAAPQAAPGPPLPGEWEGAVAGARWGRRQPGAFGVPSPGWTLPAALVTGGRRWRGAARSRRAAHCSAPGYASGAAASQKTCEAPATADAAHWREQRHDPEELLVDVWTRRATVGMAVI